MPIHYLTQPPVLVMEWERGMNRVRTLAGDDRDRAVTLAKRIGAPWYVGDLLAAGFALADVEALARAGISVDAARAAVAVAFDAP